MINASLNYCLYLAKSFLLGSSEMPSHIHCYKDKFYGFVVAARFRMAHDCHVYTFVCIIFYYSLNFPWVTLSLTIYSFNVMHEFLCSRYFVSRFIAKTRISTINFYLFMPLTLWVRASFSDYDAKKNTQPFY